MAKLSSPRRDADSDPDKAPFTEKAPRRSLVGRPNAIARVQVPPDSARRTAQHAPPSLTARRGVLCIAWSLKHLLDMLTTPRRCVGPQKFTARGVSPGLLDRRMLLCDTRQLEAQSCPAERRHFRVGSQRGLWVAALKAAGSTASRESRGERRDASASERRHAGDLAVAFGLRIGSALRCRIGAYVTGRPKRARRPTLCVAAMGAE
jgi:hypothetical protein